VNSLETERLWERGLAWLRSTKKEKDFSYGQELFLRLVQLKPTDYWANLILGGCYTWGNKVPIGETYIRKALELDETVPNAHSLLAQNLLRQGKKAESLNVVEHMIKDLTFTSVPTDTDHQEKIREAVEVAKTILGVRDPKFQNLLAIAKGKYPEIANKIDVAVLKKDEQCCCM
jgi:hypothetical protein